MATSWATARDRADPDTSRVSFRRLSAAHPVQVKIAKLWGPRPAKILHVIGLQASNCGAVQVCGGTVQ